MATIAIIGSIAFLLWLGVLIKCMLDECKEYDGRMGGPTELNSETKKREPWLKRSTKKNESHRD